MSINDGKAEEGVPLRGGEGPSAPQGEENHKIITPVLAVHLLILIGITAAERVALKVMIDRMDQYLYFILQVRCKEFTFLTEKKVCCISLFACWGSIDAVFSLSLSLSLFCVCVYVCIFIEKGEQSCAVIEECSLG